MRTIITAFLFLASLPVFATPSTLVYIPSTDIQPYKTWHLGTDSYIPNNGAAPLVDIGVTYGVAPRIEVGADLASGLVDAAGEPINKPLWLNAKIQVLTSEQSPIPVAVGIYNASPKSAANQQIIYGVGSYAFSGGPRLTLGAYSGREGGIGSSKDGVLAGLDYTRGKWWYGVDYMSGDNAVGAVSPGIGYNFADNAGVIVGYDFYNSSSVTDTWNIQYDVNF